MRQLLGLTWVALLFVIVPYINAYAAGPRVAMDGGAWLVWLGLMVAVWGGIALLGRFDDK